MAEPHTFTKDGAQRIADGIRRIESLPQAKKSGRGVPNIPLGDDVFLAVITGNASLATNRWKYAWTEVLLDGNSTTNRTDGRSGTTSTDYAINLCEINHTSTYAWGVDVTGTDYQDDFDPMPVGGGGTSTTHKYNVVVVMYQTVDVNGDLKYYFCLQGSHDGTCDT